MGDANETISAQRTKRSSTSDAQDDGLGKRVKYTNPLSGAPAPAPASGGEGENICYGMLIDDVVQLKWPPTSAQLTAIKTTYHSYGEAGSFVPLRVVLEDEVGRLAMGDGHVLGVSSNRTFRALNNLSKIMPRMTFQPLVFEAEWNEKLEFLMKQKSSHGKVSVNMNMNLILSGPRCAATQVARILASEDRFLQDPIPGAINHPYENPQSLRLPDTQLLSKTEQSTAQLLQSIEGDQLADCDQIGINTKIRPATMDLQSFLGNFPTHDDLSHVSMGSCMITKLFSHQQKAVDFILRREQGQHIPDSGLWQKTITADNVECYQHKITGAKSPTAADCSGGIIADDMGLGKTLTMLSAILKSRDAANLFARNGGIQPEAAKSTIIVVPSELLLRTWAREISKHLYPETLRVSTYHGTERRNDDSTLPSYDMILTTYGTVMAEFRKRVGVLHSRTWYRLVLDEAHTIRNSSSKQFQAVSHISSHIRWCLSGTPIQNSLDDLGSLVRFLKVPILGDASAFRKHISIEQAPDRPSAEPFENLRLLLRSISLRRNRAVLPNMMNFVTEPTPLQFTTIEREQYVTLKLTLKRLLSFAFKSQDNKSSRMKVMEALLRLRMFCNNGLEESHYDSFFTNHSKPDEILSLLQQSEEAICAFCSCDVLTINGPEDSDSGYLTRCFRVLCHDCSLKYQQTFGQANTSTCTLCEKDHGIAGLTIDDPSVATSNTLSRYPSKVEALVRDIEKHYLSGKCVVFTYWKRTLDVVERALRDRNIKHCRIDGLVSPKRRNGILTEFQNREASRVLIMTFSTGGVGLNGLTVANRVHILEPQWNPAVENQAIGRLLRLDQSKRVTVVQYVMQKTIEESIQSQQHHKIQIAGGGFADDQDRRDIKYSHLKHLGKIMKMDDEQPTSTGARADA